MKTAFQRFISKVSKGSDDPARGVYPCWEWLGYKSKYGYGQFREGNRRIPAHWFLLEKRPGKGEEACHHCDNRSCVRPSHIFIGTRLDNMRDCVNKGRNVRGERVYGARLTETQVMEIRRLYAVGELSQSQLGKQFGVNQSQISDVVTRITWKHVI